MIQMKLFYPLNKKTNRTEFYIGFILFVIGTIWLFERYYTEIAYSNSFAFVDITRIVYLNAHHNFNILYGLWTIPLCLGIVLFLDSLEILPDFEIIKSVKKYVRWKIKN